jgi:hypothetical protein
MIKKVNKFIPSFVNMELFTEEQREKLRKTKEIKTEEHGEFVKLNRKEVEKLLNFKTTVETEWSYTLSVKYKEFKPDTYDGVIITRHKNDEWEKMIQINSGDVGLDEELALDVLYDIIGEPEIKVDYSSSYDDYLSDLVSDLEDIEFE